MTTLQLVLEGAGEVLLAGLVFGAGLPLVYALALRVLTIGATAYADPDGVVHSRPRLSSRVFAAALVAVVVAGIALGLLLIVATGLGKEVTFENIYPTVVDK